MPATAIPPITAAAIPFPCPIAPASFCGGAVDEGLLELEDEVWALETVVSVEVLEEADAEELVDPVEEGGEGALLELDPETGAEDDGGGLGVAGVGTGGAGASVEMVALESVVGTLPLGSVVGTLALGLVVGTLTLGLVVGTLALGLVVGTFAGAVAVREAEVTAELPLGA
ncbi:hypothetical protein EV356DRAFT_536616 [Viridothelium virens]|uniref:Uncharacterized protein n=1 Tax=Viridothelium virens TaxID=1048519 RepID=A0A6A6GWQ4_VIRVR|nr:hypothetical protein EV356DRAFT_536616 [Viridothelium virens]